MASNSKRSSIAKTFPSSPGFVREAMRYLVSMTLSVILLFAAFWAASRLAISVNQGSSETSDFLAGRMLDLCGYQVDARFGLAGYDLDEWKGSRCDTLSELDECLLECLASAGAVEIAADCYDICWQARGR